MLEILYTFYSFKPHENEKCLAKRLNGDNLVGFEPTTYCSSTELWPLGHTTPYPLHYGMHATSPGFRLWDWNMRKGQWVCVKSKLNTHYCKWGQFENCGPLDCLFPPPKKKLGIDSHESFRHSTTFQQFTMVTIVFTIYCKTKTKIIFIIISCISTCLYELDF